MENVPFGVADIFIDEGGADELAFDGKNFLQADGGEVNIEPILAEIKFQDYGDATVDDLINGYGGTVKVVASKNAIEILKLALGHGTVAVDGVTSAETITDSKVGTSMRAKGKSIRIHPREMGADKTLDINIYKATSVGAFARTYSAEQGKYEIELKLYPKDGADASKDGNYFYVGETDPNAVA